MREQLRATGCALIVVLALVAFGALLALTITAAELDQHRQGAESE